MFGEQLDLDAFERVNVDWIEEIAGTLKRAGSNVDLWELLSSHPPDSVPTRADYPGAPKDEGNCGFLAADQVKVIAADLARVTLPDDAEPLMVDAVEELRGWFTEAAGQNTGPAPFY